MYLTVYVHYGTELVYDFNFRGLKCMKNKTMLVALNKLSRRADWRGRVAIQE